MTSYADIYKYGGPTRPPVMVSGAPTVKSPTDFQYASNTPVSQAKPTGGFLTGISTVFNSVGTLAGNLGLTNSPATAAQISNSNGTGGSSPTVSTAQVDGQTGFVNGLTDRIQGVLATIGSIGDGLDNFRAQNEAQFYRASAPNNGGSGLNVAVIAAVIGVAGVIYIATKD